MFIFRVLSRKFSVLSNSKQTMLHEIFNNKLSEICVSLKCLMLTAAATITIIRS